MATEMETFPNSAQNIERKAEQAAYTAKDRATQATHAVSDKISTVADKLRDKTRDGRFQQAGENVASGIERAGSYLREHDLQSVGSEVSSVFRRYPVQTTLVGLGLGVLIGKALTASSTKRA